MKLYINLFFLFILLIGSPGISAKSILPVNGAIAKYQCKGGPTTERNVAYWTEKSDKIVFRDSWSRGIKGKLFEEDGLADSADFLIGIAQHWVLNRSFRSLKHLNGNLKKVISLEKGQYTGQLSVETSNKTYKAVATITIGDKSTVTSGMGSLLSVPIETKITNIDGKGGVLSISSQFSPALRLFTKKTVKGPRSDNFTNFVCELTATKIESEPKGSAKQLKFAWPEVGRKTSYSCVGTISRYSVEVLKNDGQTVTLKTISPFGIDILTGTPKQFYFGLASLADSRNIRSYDIRDIFIESTAEPKKKIDTHAYSGRFTKILQSNSNKGLRLEGQFFSTLTPRYLPFQDRKFGKELITGTRIRTAVRLKNSEEYYQMVYSQELQNAVTISKNEIVNGKPRGYFCEVMSRIQ